MRFEDIRSYRELVNASEGQNSPLLVLGNHVLCLHDASDMEVDMRKLIAGMQISVDGKIAGTEGYADWVEAWSDNFDLMPQVDACLLGGGMYPGHEQYWTAVQNNEPGKPLPFTGRVP